MAQMDKSYAWWSAKRYAEILPQELSEIPNLLVSAMRSQSSKPNATDTKDATR